MVQERIPLARCVARQANGVVEGIVQMIWIRWSFLDETAVLLTLVSTIRLDKSDAPKRPSGHSSQQ